MYAKAFDVRDWHVMASADHANGKGMQKNVVQLSLGGIQSFEKNLRK